jgi:DNA-binding NtrC family response regulator
MTVRSIVVADDEMLNRELMAEICSRLDRKVRTAKDGLHALKALETEPADLLITDLRMPGMGGLKLLAKVRERWPHLPVVIMTAFASVDSAIECIRHGAYDYLMKPFGPEQVEALLKRLDERQQLVTQVSVLQEEVRDRHRARTFVGESKHMQRILGVVERAAASPATVLIQGPSGSGKELVARALHQLSPRASGPFIKVNCAALTDSLLASELFGHEKGSFTGAEKLRVGRFEAASGGTLLLDEISEISPEMQAKLLRALEEHEIERIGSNDPIKVDVRVVATTNRHLPDSVAAGDFRADLYYRLNVVPVILPGLAQRRDDIPLLIDHYRQHFAGECGTAFDLTAAAIQRLQEYNWPGNIRELVNVVERLTVLAGDAKIDDDDLLVWLPELSTSNGRPSSATTLAALEEQHIQEALADCGGDQAAAAEQLGISKRSLSTRLKKMHIVAA